MNFKIDNNSNTLKENSFKFLLYELWKNISKRRKKKLFILLILLLTSSLTEILSLASLIPFLTVLSNPYKLWEIDLIKKYAFRLEIFDPNYLILPFTVIFILFAALSSLIRLFNSYINRKWAAELGADLSSSIYKRTLYQPYKIQIRTETSEIIASVLTDIQSMINGVINPILNIITSSIILLSILFTLLTISWFYSLTSGAVIFVVYLISLILTKKPLFKYGDTILSYRRKVITNIQEGMGSIRDIILDNNQQFYSEIHNKFDRKLRITQPKMFFLQAFPRSIVEPTGIAVIATVGLILVRNGTLEEALPLLGVLALGAQKILPYSQKIYEGISSLNGTKPMLERIIAHLNQNKDLMICRQEIINFRFKSEIILENIYFKYSKNSKYVLRDLSLKIKKGERIGLIGKTGSGKSTLVDIIMSLLEPTKGKIIIDGSNIFKSKENNILQKWRSVIAHVPQNIYMKNSSIAENIAFGVPLDSINMDKVKDAAKKANISEHIEASDEGYKSYVGERGIQLSGGQRQRIAIARALYKDCQVLILDEATSALDNETENNIIQTLNGVNNDITLIIIAHRLSTIKNCTRVLKLDNGQIVDSNQNKINK